MPTEEVCYKYDHLQNSVVALLELKKVAEKLDINTKVIKGRVSGNTLHFQSTHLYLFSFRNIHCLSPVHLPIVQPMNVVES